jgi:hypothetical protein
MSEEKKSELEQAAISYQEKEGSAYDYSDLVDYCRSDFTAGGRWAAARILERAREDHLGCYERLETIIEELTK